MIRPTLLLAALLVMNFGAGMALASDPCTERTQVVLGAEGSGTHVCEELRASGPLTVRGTFILQDSSLTFTGGAGALVVENGGRLGLERTIIRAAAGSSFSVDLKAGSQAVAANSTFVSPSSFTIRNDAKLENVTIQDSPGTALFVAAGNASLTNLSVEKAVTGIRVSAAASPTLTGANVTDVAGIALVVSGTARIVATRSNFEGDAGALSLEGPVNVTLRESSLGGPATLGTLTGTAQGAPSLSLESTVVDPARIQRGQGARLNVAWQVQVRVQEDPTSPGVFLSGVQVTPKDASGNALPDMRTNATGFAPVLLVPQASYVGPSTTPSTENNPWQFAVRQNSSANSTSVNVTTDRLNGNPITVPLPLDNDLSGPTAPVLQVIGGTVVEGKQYSGNGSVQLSWEPANDNPGDHPNRGVASYEVLHQQPDGFYRLLNSTTTTLALAPIGAGTHAFRVRGVDLADNRGNYSNQKEVTVDSSSPLVEVSSFPIPSTVTSEPVTAGQGALRDVFHFREKFNLTAKAKDNDTAISSLTYRLGPSAPFAAYSAAITFDPASTPTDTVVTFRAVNSAGVATEVQTRVILDQMPPILTLDVTPAVPDGAAGWIRGALALNASAADMGPSGVARIRYSLDDGNWTPLTRQVQLNITGEHLLKVRAEDYAGNNATTQRTLRRDSLPPVINVTVSGPMGSAEWYRGPIEVQVKIEENGSGLARSTHRFGTGLASAFVSPIKILSSGTHALHLEAVDVAGNVASLDVVLQMDAEAPVAGVPQLAATDDGRVSLQWPDSPPMDLVSGLAGIFLERTDAAGRVLHSVALQASDRTVLAGPYPAGLHVFRVRVADHAGHEAFTPSIQVSVAGFGLDDTGAPGEAVPARGTIRIAFDAPAGFEAAEVQFILDGRLRAASAQAPFEFTWDTTGHANGLAEVLLLARGADGSELSQSFSYDIGNGYGPAVAESPVAAGAAALASLAALVLGALGLAASRRWFA